MRKRRERAEATCDFLCEECLLDWREASDLALQIETMEVAFVVFPHDLIRVKEQLAREARQR